MWGLGRLGRVRPDLVVAAVPFIPPYFASPQGLLRGLAVWVAGALSVLAWEAALHALRHDPASILLFDQGRLTEHTVGELAAAAIV